MTTALTIAPGSLGAIAQRDGVSLAESFTSCDALVLVDVSSSMQERDAPDGRTRYGAALDELTTLQAHLPGKVGVIAFASGVQFVPGGLPPMTGGTTNLAQALQFAQVADAVAGMRFVVVSDGQPDSEAEALCIAEQYQNQIDTVYVGPETHPYGREFLRKLAALKNGQHVMADRTLRLADKVETLLLAA